MHDHIEVYGPDNHLRLTGLHETQSIDTFSYGVADRGASIRVPHSFVDNGYRGYLEDRRPNSQGDPYRIAGRIIETIAMVDVDRRARTRASERPDGGDEVGRRPCPPADESAPSARRTPAPQMKERPRTTPERR